MRAYQFLIEYSQGPLLRTFGPALVSRWQKEGEPFLDEMEVDDEGNVTPESILHWIEKQDSTENNKYTTWMVHRYVSKNSNIRLEDLQTQAREDLVKFHNLSRKQNFPQEYKSIDVFKSLPDLSKFLRQYEQDKSEEQIQKELTDLEKGELLLKQGKDVELLLDTSEYRVIIPKTFEMSKFFGKTIANSSWCITSSKNFWNEYIIDEKDSAYFIIHKPNNSWWAWVIKSDEYRDINDEEIDDLDMFIKQHKPAVNVIIKHFGGLNKLAISNTVKWFKYVKKSSQEQIGLSIVKKNGLSIQYIKNPSEAIQLAAVKQYAYSLEHIVNMGIFPSEKVQLIAVKQKASTIRLINDPSKKIQLAAVKQDGNIIKSIGNPSEEVQIAAVRQNEYVIRHIENPFEKVQLVAVTQDGEVLQHIENPSEEIQLAAVTQNGFAIEFIENPSEAVQLIAVIEVGSVIQHIENPSEEVKLAAVKQNGFTIKYIKNPSEEIQLIAVKNSKYAIQYIKNPTEEIQLAAVEENGHAIQFIRNPSEIIKLIAVKKDGFSIHHIKNPSEEMKLEAVKETELVFPYIKNPTEEMQLVAIKKDGLMLGYIKNPSEEMQLTAIKQNKEAIQYIENPSKVIKQFIQNNQ